MLLSPTLRKIATAALLLPAAVVANSSYADCASDKSYSTLLEGEHWQLVREAEYKNGRSERVAVPDESKRVSDGRLSRRDFYGRQAPIAIIEL